MSEPIIYQIGKNDGSNYPDGSPWRMIVVSQGFDDHAVEAQLHDEFIDCSSTLSGLIGYSVTVISPAITAALEAAAQRVIDSAECDDKIGCVIGFEGPVMYHDDDCAVTVAANHARLVMEGDGGK